MGRVIYYDINQGILRNVSENTTILDIGCGPGFLGEKIKQRYPGTTVYGIDNSKDTLKIAQKRLDKIFCIDVEEISNQASKKTKKDAKMRENGAPFGNPYKLKKKSLDIIIFGDILEHLYHPDLVVAHYKQYLKEDGKIIFSLPNVASWIIRLKLLFGNFTYTDSGILDGSHLRFYTIKTAKRFIKDNGLYIEKIDITPNLVRAFIPLIRILFSAFTNHKTESFNVNKAIFNSKLYLAYLDFISPIETIIAKIWRTLFAYQFIFVTKIKK